MNRAHITGVVTAAVAAGLILWGLRSLREPTPASKPPPRAQLERPDPEPVRGRPAAESNAQAEPDGPSEQLSPADRLAIEAALQEAEVQAKQARDEAADESLAYLNGMRTASMAYDAAFKTLLEMPPCPAGNPTEGPHDWEGECTDAWDGLGWQPDSMEVDTGSRLATLCQYEIVIVDDGEGIQAIARCDGDQDGQLELFVATMEDPAAAVD